MSLLPHLSPFHPPVRHALYTLFPIANTPNQPRLSLRMTLTIGHVKHTYPAPCGPPYLPHCPGQPSQYGHLHLAY